MRTEETYYHIKHQIAEAAKELFQYRGSATESYPPDSTFENAYRHVSADKDDLEGLVKRGILPALYIGSRSQGYEWFSTNFCLDIFQKYGINDPTRMILLAEAGITPFHVGHITKAGWRASRMKPSTVIKTIERVYDREFEPVTELYCSLCGNLSSVYSPEGTGVVDVRGLPYASKIHLERKKDD